MSITYDGAPRSEGTQTGGHVLVFVEISPGDVPPVPFTIKDACRLDDRDLGAASSVNPLHQHERDSLEDRGTMAACVLATSHSRLLS